ncbi:hypothetical protein CF336_g1500 [Tilletia laevis]|nr:hypothetical protein CF336_g1500 [Tilletia laevis]KAE8204010.1 hypothetical protein CF335_g2809 [Tilletia laevis]
MRLVSSLNPQTTTARAPPPGRAVNGGTGRDDAGCSRSWHVKQFSNTLLDFKMPPSALSLWSIEDPGLPLSRRSKM